MADDEKTNPTRPVSFRIPLQSYAHLEYLTRYGHYGKTPGEVAKSLMNRVLDDLTRSGIRPPGESPE